jgi:hypothetical protein
MVASEHQVLRGCECFPIVDRLPGLRVLSREFSEELGGRLVVEAAQAGVVVIGDEGVEVGIAFGMVEKAG